MSSIPAAVGEIFAEEGLLDIFALGLVDDLPDPANWPILRSSYVTLEPKAVDDFLLSVSCVIDIELPKENLFPACVCRSGDGVGILSSRMMVKSNGSSRRVSRARYS